MAWDRRHRTNDLALPQFRTREGTIHAENQKRNPSPGHGKTPLRFAGNTTVALATITAMFAVLLSVFSPNISMAFEDTYYFTLRQLSAARDLVNHAASLF